MLESQRPLFDMPRDVCWLNAAAYGPMPLASRAAAERGVARKIRPWELEPTNAQRHFERARTAAARLINADPDDVAIIPSVSYGVATAGRVLPLERGTRVLLLQDDHTSPVLEWMARSEAQGALLETVKRPSDGDWTRALLDALNRPTPRVGVVSISSVHWSDGGAVDLLSLVPALRRHGASLIIDATHSAGVMSIDVRELDPDFLIFPTYKWVLGPYGRAFLYVARRGQTGVPLEQTGAGRLSINSEAGPYLRDTRYVLNAKRYDMGERDHFITLELASIGMELMARWGPQAVTERLRMLTARLVAGLHNIPGILIPEDRVRAPHVLSVAFSAGMPSGLVERLAGRQVYVSPRLDRLRISPHVYNDEEDIDHFLNVFRRAIA